MDVTSKSPSVIGIIFLIEVKKALRLMLFD